MVKIKVVKIKVVKIKVVKIKVMVKAGFQNSADAHLDVHTICTIKPHDALDELCISLIQMQHYVTHLTILTNC